MPTNPRLGDAGLFSPYDGCGFRKFIRHAIVSLRRIM